MKKNEASALDKLLHSTSVMLGSIISNNYTDMPDDMADDLIVAFRNIRRHISKDKTGKRYGAAEAHRAMLS